LKLQNEGPVLKRKYGTQKSGEPVHTLASKASQEGGESVSSDLSVQAAGWTSVQIFSLSPSDKLACRFCELLGSGIQVQPGTNLAAFGKFMIDVPVHIGRSRVFDLSVESLYLAHGSLFAKKEHLLLRSQRLYGEALQSLQRKSNMMRELPRRCAQRYSLVSMTFVAFDLLKHS
jgi:hypothetical protein